MGPSVLYSRRNICKPISSRGNRSSSEKSDTRLICASGLFPRRSSAQYRGVARLWCVAIVLEAPPPPLPCDQAHPPRTPSGAWLRERLSARTRGCQAPAAPPRPCPPATAGGPLGRGKRASAASEAATAAAPAAACARAAAGLPACPAGEGGGARRRRRRSSRVAPPPPGGAGRGCAASAAGSHGWPKRKPGRRRACVVLQPYEKRGHLR